MKIKKIQLNDFRGIEFLESNLEPGKNMITGPNGAGKTTVYDAFSWILFNKDSKGDTRFDIFNMDNESDFVTASLSIEEAGNETILMRTAKRTKTGASYSYSIDGYKKKKTEYDAFLESFIDIEKYRILSDPLYFADGLHWARRREILFGMIPEIEIDTSGLSISDEIESHSTEEIKSKYSEILKNLKKKVETYPSTISELKKHIIKPDALLPEKINALENKLEDAQAESNAANIRSEIKSLQADLKSSLQAAEYSHGKTIQEKSYEINALKATVSKKEIDWTALDKLIQSREDQMQNLRKEYTEKANQAFSDSENCPTCGQVIPEEMLNQAREEFNLEKSKRLEAISAEGKALKAENEKAKLEKTNIENMIAEAEAKVADLEKEISNIESALESEKSNLRADIEKQIAGLESKADVSIDIESLKKQLSNLYAARAQEENSAKTQKRISELKAEQKAISSELEKAESALDELSGYIIQKARKAEEEINKLFPSINWVLFEKQGNGELKETCEAYIDETPFRSRSTGERIKDGLEIIKIIQAQWKATVPVWIDNAESVLQIPEMDCQTIQLRVSDIHELKIN